MARKRNKYYGTYNIHSKNLKKAFYTAKGELDRIDKNDHHYQMYVVLKCSGRKDGDSILRSVGLIDDRNFFKW